MVGSYQSQFALPPASQQHKSRKKLSKYMDKAIHTRRTINVAKGKL